MAKAFWAEFCCATLVLVTAGCSQAPSDAVIAADARNRIGADQRVQSSQIQVSANHGALSLSGSVPSDAARMAAAEDASQSQGLKVLVNNLRIADVAQPVEVSPPVSTTPSEKTSHSVDSGQPRTPDPPRKPSPALAKAEPSTLPIVTDPAASGTNASTQNHPLTTQPSVAAANPAANLPTRPTDASSLPASTNSSQATPAPVVIPTKAHKISIPYGTVLSVRLLDTVSSDVNQPGDKFAATLASPVMIDDKVVIPAEAGLHGKVVQVENGGRFSGKPSLAIEINELSYNGETYSLSTSQFSKEGTSRSTRTAETIGGGAGVGAILGAIVGGGRGAAIGAAIGAGIGTGVEAKSKPNQVQLPSETVLSFRLKSPIEVEPSATLLRPPSASTDASADPFPNDRPVLKRRRGAGAADPDPVADPAAAPNAADPGQPTSNDPDSNAPPVLKRRPN